MWVRPLILRRILLSLIATILGLVLGYTGYTLRANQLRLRLELQQTQQQKQELDKKFNDAIQKSNELKKVNDDLQQQLQTRKQQQAILASVRVVGAPRIVPNCGDNQYAQFIYQHESGCNLNAVNYLGCRGIGQACPGSKLPCGADYACQNAFFTNYALTRYGSWYNSYLFWLNNHWW
jgi:cell division protein FtsB